MKKIFTLLTAILLSAGMHIYAWVSVSPTGTAATAPSVSYVKLTSKGNTTWQVDFYGSSYSEFRVANLSVPTKPSGVLNGRFPYSANTTSNYAYNSGGQSLYSKNFNGEIGFVYLGYEDANGWPVYHVSGIAVSKSTGNYCIYKGDFPVRMYNSDGTTKYTGTIDNDTYDHTPSLAQFKFESPNVINSTWWQYADWGYNDDYLLEIEAYNLSRTTNNYCKINFWVDDAGRKDYNGRSGPLPKAYSVQSPYISGNCNYGCYWVIPNNINEYATGYSSSNQVGDCQANSYTASVTQSGSDYNFANIAAFEEVIVDDGKDDKYYIRVYRSGGQLWAIIGEPAEYTITFKNHDNSTLQSSAWERGFTPKYTGATPTKTATAQYTYSFSGWSPTIAKATGAQTYTAQFTQTPVTYNITYNLNEGSGASNRTYTCETGLITLPTASAMTKDGYSFEGWYDNSGLTGSPVTSIPAGSTGDKTFWAKWLIKKYTVNFAVDATDSYGTVSPTSLANVPHFSTITGGGNNTTITMDNRTVTATKATDGSGYTYSFTGWTTNNANSDIQGSVTYTAHFTRAAVPYAITYNGLNGESNINPTTYNIESNDITLVAPGTRTGYTFANWTDDDNSAAVVTGIAKGSTGDRNFTATWTANSYDITYKDKDNADYSGSNRASLPATHTYNTPTNLVAGVKSGYNFLGWFDNADCEGDAIETIGATAKTAAFTLYAKWELAATYSSVTFTAGEHGSVSGAIGGVAINSGDEQVDGSTITLTATPDNFYSFVEWRNASNEQVVSTNAEYSFTLAEAVNLTAVFALQETIELTDNFENGSQWQDDYAALLELLRAGGKTSAPKDVRIIRTFKAGRWSTFSLPFNYSFQNPNNNTFRDQVYYLISAEYKEGGYLTLNCMPNTYRIEANKPYILIPDANIVNPVFENVKLTEIVDNSYSASDKNGSGSVIFRNTQYRQIIYNEESSINKRTIYLSNNRLYYPGTTDMYMNAFRGYFYMDYENIFHSPARIRLMNDMGEQIETLPEGEEETSAEVKKYIENGILVIERGGVKYDAQGHKLN